MGHMAGDVSSIDVGAMLKQTVKISNRFARDTTLFDIVVVYIGSELRTWGKV